MCFAHATTYAAAAGTDSLCALKITSTPEGAVVILNDVPRGETPVLCGSLLPGTYYLALQKPGYLTATDTIDVTEAQIIVRDIRLQRAASLRVESDPSGSMVFVDGQPVGEAPVVLENLRPGVIAVRVSRSGFTVYEQSVVLVEGRESNVRATLAPDVGALSLTTDPPDVDVLINGNPVEETLLHDYRLPRGKYSIGVRRRGSDQILSHDFFVPAGATIRLHADVEKRSLRPLLYSLLLPGLGQLQAGADGKAIAFFACVGSAATLTGIGLVRYNPIRSAYDDLRTRYESSRTELEAQQLGEELARKHNDLKKANVLRVVGLSALVATYIASALDAWFNHGTTSEFRALPSTGITTGMLPGHPQQEGFEVTVSLHL